MFLGFWVFYVQHLGGQRGVPSKRIWKQLLSVGSETVIESIEVEVDEAAVTVALLAHGS